MKTKKLLTLLASMIVLLASALNLVAQAPVSKLYGVIDYGLGNDGLIYALNADGSGFTIVKDFIYGDGNGTRPTGGLIQGHDGVLYGVGSGADGNSGHIFRIDPDGANYATLRELTFDTGTRPTGPLVQHQDGTLFGMTYIGSPPSGSGAGSGTIFKINPDGTGFSVLHAFTEGNGYVHGALTLASDGLLYGMTAGGNSFTGNIFKINTDGSDFAVIHTFHGMFGGISGSLIEGLDGSLYGLTFNGGISDQGTAFKINKDGSGFTTLHIFTSSTGSEPNGSLTQGPDGTLYGTTYAGGTNINTASGINNTPIRTGVIFRLNPDGTGFTVLHNYENISGSNPLGITLILHDNILYGCTTFGGANNEGVVYQYDLTTSTYTKLVDLTSQTGIPNYTRLLFVNSMVVTPTTPAGTISISDVQLKSFHVSVTPGNGARRLVVMRPLSAPTFIPVNNTLYSGNLGNGQTVVYDGTGNAFDVTGLDPETEYFLTVFEFNTDSSVTRYLTTHTPVASVQTLTQPDTQVQLFGLTNEQGAYGAGTIIKFNAGEDENNLSVLHNFKHQDGGAAYGALLQADDGLLYGVTAGYFTDANKGTVFSIRPDGTGYTVLHGFQDPEGINPTGTLIQASDGLLYGLTRYGGLTGNGSVFRMNPDGSGFTVLHHFVYLSDGASPTGKLLQVADGSLLGVCATGGTYNVGTIFSIQPDGTGFTVLRHFQTTAQSYPDGSLTRGPGASVVGMTAGSSNLTPGTIYSINTDGSGFTILHFFAPELGYPHAELVRTGGKYYGITGGDFSTTYGTLFSIHEDGTGYTTLHHFQPPGGIHPFGGLLLQDNTLYGMTAYGGESNGGVTFKYDLATSTYHDLANLDNTTGNRPWGNLIAVTVPRTIDSLYVINPSDRSTKVPLNPTVSATVVPLASTYTIELNTDPDFGSASAIVKTGGASIGFTGLSLNTTYYARVMTNRSIYWGKTTQFKTGTAQDLSYVVSPGNNHTHVSWNPTVTVNTIPGASQYTVQLSTTNDFASPIEQTGTTVNFIYTGLIYNTKYYTRVTTNLTPGAWGPTRRFTTGDPVSMAYVKNPADNAMNVYPTLSITANVVTGASSYTIQLSETSDFTIIAFENNGSSNVLPFAGLKYHQQYYARVRTDLSASFGRVTTFTTRTAESISFVVSPGNNAVDVKNTLNITSNSVPGASSYTIQLSESPTFSTIAFEVTGPTRVLSFTGLEYNTHYYNRVKTNMSTEFGEVRSFTTRTAESLAYVISPANNATNVPTTVSITSNHVPGATSYTIQLSRSADFGSIAFQMTGSTRTLAFTGLLNNVRYYNRVRTNLSPVFGQRGVFRTVPASARVATTAELESPEAFHVSAYPNPFSDKLTVLVESADADEADITLVDLNNRIVFEAAIPTNKTHDVAHKLASGLYLLRVRAGAFIQVKKVAKN